MARFDFLKRRKGRSAHVGRMGEDAAAWHLWWRGYRIIERNYSNDFGEIDIVAEQHGVCVFIEVKTRSKDDPLPDPDDLADSAEAAADGGAGSVATSSETPLERPPITNERGGRPAPYERDALEAIDARKKRNMKAAARVYLNGFLPARFPHRFDAIKVDLRGGKARVRAHVPAIMAPLAEDHVALHSGEARHLEEALRAALAATETEREKEASADDHPIGSTPTRRGVEASRGRRMNAADAATNPAADVAASAAESAADSAAPPASAPVAAPPTRRRPTR
jgi:Holliday junction resolvase-like predicted endonuclease